MENGSKGRHRKYFIEEIQTVGGPFNKISTACCQRCPESSPSPQRGGIAFLAPLTANSAVRRNKFRPQFHLVSYMEVNCYLSSQRSDILQHSQNRPTGDRWLKLLTYDNLDHKIKLKIRQFQLMGKVQGKLIKNTGYEWYIGS